MKSIKPYASPADRLERQETIRLLRETPPQILRELSEQATLQAFARAAKKAPFYRRMLSEQGIDVAAISSIAAFREHAPVLDKHNTFGQHDIAELCLDGSLDGVRSLLTSSGHSGVFSFGVNTRDNLQRSAKSTDLGLQYLFQTDDKSTLLINCLPMGVKVHTDATFLAETSVREDMVFAVIKKFSAEFEQVILVGEASFIKKIIEEGHELHGIDWPSVQLQIVTGEEGIAENYRSYIAELIGLSDFDNPNGKLIGSSMGVAELDLNLFHETRETIRIRRLAHRNPALRRALFGEDTRCCPMFFIYYPNRCYIETLDRDDQQQELVVSMLSEEMKIPLLRYRSGDCGALFDYEQVVAILREHDIGLTPDLKLPFIAVSGRGKFVDGADGRLYPEAVKEALYADKRIAATITGNFRMSQVEGETLVAVQLRPGRAIPAGATEILSAALAEYSSATAHFHFWQHAEFPYNCGVDYERKFAYL
ncbi:hypothetical protein [Undibacterium pigrum]|uniref:Phenylacetate-CoA ligase n=1 Tax=Undibacterium pigrum TaxID=401470 RepID=A0A318IMT2_9BURK|nr:hypothetical protein [Undibacterium pigrum]PXX35321.1 phenylacetate-CoA ligase [Undibacterium pigrum]